MKYRKTALIDAVQFNHPGDHPAVVATDQSPTGFAIMTLENTNVLFEVTPTDWIATGADGAHWAIKDPIFRKTYELVAE